MSRDKSRKIYFSLGATLLVLIFFNYLGWLNPLKNFLHSFFSDDFIRISEVGKIANQNYKFASNKQSFFEAFDKCTADVEQLSVYKAKTILLEEENSELKKLVGYKDRVKIPLVPAKIIGRNPDGMDKAVLIDQGSRSGIKVNQPVIVGNGILVGKVSKVEDRVSFVRLINDNQNKVAATILNKEKSLGVVEGGYGISVRMNFIPRNETILIGDEVVSSGLETNVPRGLVIGTVAAIENEAYQPFQQAVLTPATDMSKLTMVAVLITN